MTCLLSSLRCQQCTGSVVSVTTLFFSSCCTRCVSIECDRSRIVFATFNPVCFLFLSAGNFACIPQRYIYPVDKTRPNEFGRAFKAADGEEDTHAAPVHGEDQVCIQRLASAED